MIVIHNYLSVSLSPTNIVSLNPAHGEVYLIKVIKLSDLRQVGGFLLDVILHGFMVQIIYTTVFQENHDINITYHIDM
jgi:hypothetical protein